MLPWLLGRVKECNHLHHITSLTCHEPGSNRICNSSPLRFQKVLCVISWIVAWSGRPFCSDSDSKHPRSSGILGPSDRLDRSSTSRTSRIPSHSLHTRIFPHFHYVFRVSPVSPTEFWASCDHKMYSATAGKRLPRGIQETYMWICHTHRIYRRCTLHAYTVCTYL